MSFLRRTMCAIVTAAVGGAAACGGSNDGDDGGGGSGASAGGSAASGSGGAGAGSGGSGGAGAGSGGSFSGVGGSFNPGSGGAGTGNTGGSGADCSADFAPAALVPVYLAFAFDVSGSMGKGDKEWHDREAKWDPVVQATKSFFADETASGLSASLTFFPAEEDRCEVGVYSDPAVPMTALPSPAFAEAIDAVTPETEDDWRGGTPTLAVVEGTLQYIEAQQQQTPGKYVVVLVTDGYPEGCSDEENSIEAVAEVVAAAAERVPTYVIGVENPPGGPDYVSNLELIAQAGGSETIYNVSTGDPVVTAARFRDAIAAIRSQAISCEAAIPETPGGQPFDRTKVNVNYDNGGESQQLGFDPTCEADNAWRYDDDEAPSRIVLCPSTCSAVQSNASAALRVEFGCATRPPEAPE